MFAELLILAALSDSVTTHHRIATAPAETLRAEVRGDGPIVVIIPGMVGGAFGWRRVAAELEAAGHRVVIIEMLGTGGSGRPARADYSLAAQATRIAGALDTLGVHQATLVAHGGSGGVAFRLALARPDLVTAMISVEAGPGEEAASAGMRRALKLAPLLKLFGGSGKLRGKVAKAMREGSADPSWVSDSVIAGYTKDASADFGATLRAFQGMGRAREPYLIADSLSGISVPVTLLHGGHPHQGGMNQEELDRLRRLLPVLIEETVDGAGHFIHEERPGAVVAAIVRSRGRTLAGES